MSSARSLTPEQSGRVRDAIRTLWKKYGTQSLVASELGVSQQTISAVLGGMGAGVALAAAASRVLHVSFDELINGPRTRTAGMLYGALPGWDEACDRARMTRRSPDYALIAVGTLPVSVSPEVVTPEFVVRLALFWLEYAPLSEREAAEKALRPVRWRSRLKRPIARSR